MIDEYAKIARSLDWFNPKAPPSSAFNAAINIYIYIWDIFKMNAINIKGANFCHDDRIKQFNHEIDVITEGYHMWNGATPNLIANLIDNIADIKLMLGDVIHNENLVIISILDPSAWIKKYFTAASVSWYILVDDIIGIKHSKLSSIIIHINIQLVLEMASNDLIIKDIRSSVWNWFFIKTWIIKYPNTKLEAFILMS